MQSNSQRRRSRRDDAASSRKLDRIKRRDVEKYDSGDAASKWNQEDDKIKNEHEEWQLDQEVSSHWTVEFQGPYYKYKCVGKEQKEKGEGKDQECGENRRHKESDEDDEIYRVEDYEDDDIQDDEAEEDGDPDSETEEDADAEEEDEDDERAALLGECEYAEAEVMTERHDDVSDKSVGDPKDANNIYFWTYALLIGLFLAFTLYLTFNVLPFEMKIVKEKTIKVKHNEIEE